MERIYANLHKVPDRMFGDFISKLSLYYGFLPLAASAFCSNACVSECIHKVLIITVSNTWNIKLRPDMSYSICAANYTGRSM